MKIGSVLQTKGEKRLFRLAKGHFMAIREEPWRRARPGCFRSLKRHQVEETRLLSFFFYFLKQTLKYSFSGHCTSAPWLNNPSSFLSLWNLLSRIQRKVGTLSIRAGPSMFITLLWWKLFPTISYSLQCITSGYFPPPFNPSTSSRWEKRNWRFLESGWWLWAWVVRRRHAVPLCSK